VLVETSPADNNHYYAALLNNKLESLDLAVLYAVFLPPIQTTALET